MDCIIEFLFDVIASTRAFLDTFSPWRYSHHQKLLMSHTLNNKAELNVNNVIKTIFGHYYFFNNMGKGRHTGG